MPYSSNGISVQALRDWVQENTTESPSRVSGSFFWQENRYTLEQVKQHNTFNDGWAVDFKSGDVYNITPLFFEGLLNHPYIDKSTMRENFLKRLGGGCDISVDKANHRGARVMGLWAAMRIGKLDR